MNFLWVFGLIFSLYVTMISADLKCPAGLKAHGAVCGVQRTVRGTCPDNTQYSANVNLCVQK